MTVGLESKVRMPGSQSRRYMSADLKYFGEGELPALRTRHRYTVSSLRGVGGISSGCIRGGGLTI